MCKNWTSPSKLKKNIWRKIKSSCLLLGPGLRLAILPGEEEAQFVFVWRNCTFVLFLGQLFEKSQYQPINRTFPRTARWEFWSDQSHIRCCLCFFFLFFFQIKTHRMRVKYFARTKRRKEKWARFENVYAWFNLVQLESAFAIDQLLSKRSTWPPFMKCVSGFWAIAERRLCFFKYIFIYTYIMKIISLEEDLRSLYLSMDFFFEILLKHIISIGRTLSLFSNI